MSASYERTKIIRRKYAKYFDQGRPILEIGFGDGTLMQLMQEQGYSVMGVDRNARWVERALGRNLRAVEGDALRFLREHEEAFGGIILSHVIEHIPVERNDALIEACFRSLTGNGMILIITPNVHTLSGAADFWNDPSHVRAYTLESLQRLLAGGGFEVVDLGFDRDTAFRLRRDPLRFPLDLVRLGLGLACFGWAARFSEIFAVGRKGPPGPRAVFAGRGEGAGGAMQSDSQGRRECRECAG